LSFIFVFHHEVHEAARRFIDISFVVLGGLRGKKIVLYKSAESASKNP
jgi:hypothetical protein